MSEAKSPNAPAANPLLEINTLPYGAPQLGAVKPEHYLPAFTAAISEAKAAIEDIKNNRAAPTFENTIAALHFSLTGEKKNFGGDYTRVMGVYANLGAAQANKEFQAAQGPIEELTTKFTDSVMMDEGLFKRIKAVHDGLATSGLTVEQKATVEETFRIFSRNGALLSDESIDGKPSEKQQLRDINQNLAGLYAKFSDNVKGARGAYQKIVEDVTELKGVPQRVLDTFHENAEKAGLPGKWVITLSPPPGEVLAYAENRALREEIGTAMKNVATGGAFDNRPVVLDIIRERHKKAQLMGFDTFADYMLNDKMAKTAPAVEEFLEKNLAAYRPAAEDFLKKVKDYALKTDGLAEADFRSTDLGYYSRRLKEETFNINLERDVLPYFKLENVMDGLKQHVKKLFNVDMEEAPEGRYPVFNKDVKAYEIKREGEMLGVFYGDYFARQGEKSDGAWMEIFRNRGIDDTGENRCPIVINCCTFQKPPEGKPALLSMREATTVFHEFGHALHALLAKGDNPLVTGYRVKQDAVETMSQLQENWVAQPEVLATFAKHYQTGEVFPVERVKTLEAMEKFDAGLGGLGQTFYGLLDMKCHSTDPSKLTSLEAIEDEIAGKASLFPRNGLMSTAFKHLFSSDEYAAGYYGYKWSEMLEADIFAQAKKAGLYNPAFAAKMENTIYSQGGIRDFMDLFVDLVGREPDPAALFRREGILPEEPEQKTPANSNSPKAPKQNFG